MSKYKVGEKVEVITLENHSVFAEELKLIPDEKIRDFVAYVLDHAPKYFYHVPASSSGKYHPKQDLGEGGLVRHTKAVVRVAMDLLRSEAFVEDSKYFRNIAISACLLHDTFKNGIEDSGHTVSNHPLLASEYILSSYKEKNLKDLYVMIQVIRQCIESHMGKWNTDKETKKEILPKPESELEKLVHMADYIASRKYINFEDLGGKK